MKTNQEQATTQDYTKWLKKDLWQMHKAVSLSVGLKPDNTEGLRHPRDILRKISDATVRARWEEVYNAAKDAIHIHLQALNKIEGLVSLDGRTSKWIGERQLEPEKFIQWAKKRGFDLPGPIGGGGGDKQESPAQRRARLIKLVKKEKAKAKATGVSGHSQCRRPL